MKLNERLQQFRERAGYENAKLFAKAIGMPYSTYSTYESGKSEPKATALIRIASALHVSVDDLLGYRVNDFDKAATLLHDSVGGRAVLDGSYVRLSDMPPSAWNTHLPIRKAVFINAINDCLKEFNQKTRPQILKNMIINKLNEIFYQEAQMTIVRGLESIPKKDYQELKREIETHGIGELGDLFAGAIALYDEKNATPTAPDHDDADDKPATEKGPHSKE